MIDRAQALSAVQLAARETHLHPATEEGMKISDFCGDSLEYLQLLIVVECNLGLEKDLPDGAKPSPGSTVGELADWIVRCANG